MSKTKTIYVVNDDNFSKLRNSRKLCGRCSKRFEINDIVASSTNKKYCYQCATKINLVSGNLKKDLEISKLKSNTINAIKAIIQKNNLEKTIEIKSISIIREIFAKSVLPARNVLGLASAAILIAYQMDGSQKSVEIVSLMPVSEHVIILHKSRILGILGIKLGK